MIWTKEFWRGCAERAIKTFFQSVTASIAVGVGIDEVNWLGIGSVATVATILSVATSIGNASFTAGKESENE